MDEGQDRPGVLLHICCAPDATASVERLAPHYRVTGFFHNPNIEPAEEYARRLEAAHRVAQAMVFALDVPEYVPAAWREAVAGWESEPEGGNRCQVCFRFNLAATAARAQALGLPYFATTLTISPHKRSAVILEEGERIGAAQGVGFLALDFKKQDGFKRSLEHSRALNLYRQNYCGCAFSRRELKHA